MIVDRKVLEQAVLVVVVVRSVAAVPVAAVVVGDLASVVLVVAFVAAAVPVVVVAGLAFGGCRRVSMPLIPVLVFRHLEKTYLVVVVPLVVPARLPLVGAAAVVLQDC